MSQGEPWNYQGMPQNTTTGNIQFFNPGQFQNNSQQQEFDLTKPVQGADNSQKSALNGQIPGQHAGDWNSWGNSNWTVQNNQETNSVGQGHYHNQVQGYDQSSQNQGQVYQNQTEQYQQGHSDQVAEFQGQNQYGYEGQGPYFDPSQQFNNQDPNVMQNWQQQQHHHFGQYNYQQNWNGQENHQNWNLQDNNVPQNENNGSFNLTSMQQDPNMLYQQQPGSDGQNVLNYTGQGQNQDAGTGHPVNQEFYGDQTQESDPLNSSQASDVSYDSTSCSQSITDAESSAASGFFNRSGSEPPLSSSGGSVLNQIPQDRPSEQHGNATGSSFHQEISNESLRTVQESSNEGIDKSLNPSVEAISGQLQQTSLDGAPTLPPPAVAINSADANGSAQKHPTENNENSESTSPQSDDTHGLSDWEMVPPQLTLSGHHSREGSLDNNNVQFFIGSSKNSSTGSTPLSFHGQNVDSDQTQQPPDGANKQFDNATNQENSSALLLPELTPQHSSSPNTLVEDQGSSQNTEKGQTLPPLPPPAATPPSGQSGGAGGTNPFRKGGTGSRTSSNASTVSEDSKSHNIQPNILFSNPPVGGEVSGSNFDKRTENRPHLDKTENIEPPSPIMSSSEETVHVKHSSQGATQKPQPQSPIMPRKESPFQPPQNRRRNLSQSSDSIEEQPKLEEKLQSDYDKGKYDRQSFTREDRNRQPVGRNRRGSGGGSDLEMQDRKGSENDRHRQYESRSRNSSERLRGKPPPGSMRNVVSPRRIHNALQQAQEKRVKHNMSPATTLWADTDLKLVPNVILAPPTPVSPAASTSKSGKDSGKEVREVLSPVENLITSLSEHISKESTPEPAGRDQSSKKREDDKSSSEHSKHHSRELRKDNSDRDRHERNSSIDRELEISRKIEEKESRGYRDRRNRSREGSLDRERERYDDDDDLRRDGRYRERGRDPRDYDSYYDPRYRDYRGHYRDPYYGDEPYERPRSRESYGYDQDYYSRQGYYDPYYYDKYYQRDARYASAYYDEYYKGNPKYNERYPPDSYYEQHYHHGYDGHDNDRYSQRSHSRVNTPGSLSDAGDQ
ncbi:hypothetical protein KUTeg_022434 [Tegillarca granosa]|uniref:Uncharacterized protein n=1 Tax=Tegillarca granosa TaxID=220873 RepID=A0ABQ9EBT5_TEGGR|nr:hypothetical protein KUTeg_022434 [Tegillarca granosa]